MTPRVPGPADDRPTVARAGDTMLEVLTGPETGRRIPVPPGDSLLGRGGHSRVLLADPDEPPAVSREHALLSWQGADLLVTDRSINGTRVAERWLSPGETEALQPGQELQLGPTLRLRLVKPHAPQAMATPALRKPVPRATPPASGRQVPRDLKTALTDRRTLHDAWRRVHLNRGGAGPDNVTIPDFARDAERRLAALQADLSAGRYQPLPPRLWAAPKRSGGVRQIAILSISDRIVQQALHSVLYPIVEPTLLPCSYAYRSGRCTHDALRAVDQLLCQGLTWVAETDIASFFDHIVHSILLDKLAALAPDPFILSLVSRCLAVAAASAGVGVAQGAATSPLFANLYLAAFDRHLTEQGWHMVRYGDDLVVPCESRARAQAALLEAEGFLRQHLHLSLKAERTRTVSLAQGFIFLGYEFREGGRRAAPKAMAELQRRLAEASPSQADLILRGWRQYFGGQAAPAPSPAAAGAVETSLDIAAFLAHFAGREDAHGRLSAHRGRVRFLPCQGPLTALQVREHIAGAASYALYPLRSDGTVRVLVLDLDLPRGAQPEDDQALAHFGLSLLATCRRVGVPASLEDSGGEGRHLWLFFAAPVPAETARQLGRLLAARAGWPQPGLRLEIMPRHCEWPGPELGEAVKLPFGVHPVTACRCHFLDDDGNPLADPAAALAGIKTITPHDAQAVVARLSAGPRVPAAPDSASISDPGRLVAGCTVVANLLAAARRDGHLRHTHRLILLYTLGRLADGPATLHQTLALCRNYAPDVTQGYLDRLDPAHAPLTCRRIREWLEEEGETTLCACGADHHSPLDILAPPPSAPRRRRSPPPPPPPRHDTAWRQVAGDLFDDPAPTDRPEGDDDDHPLR